MGRCGYFGGFPIHVGQFAFSHCCVHFWWFAPQTGVLYPSSWRQLYMAYYVVVLLLAAAGAWRLARIGAPATRLALLLGAFLFGLSALQSVYYVEARHRWAIEPMLLAISGGGVAALAGRGNGLTAHR